MIQEMTMAHVNNPTQMETIQLSGKAAINVDNMDIKGNKVGKVQLAAGIYNVSLASSLRVKLPGTTALNKIVLFSALPLKAASPGEWYVVLNTKKQIQIEIKQNHTPVYAVLLDQDTSKDDQGMATITFTKAS